MIADRAKVVPSGIYHYYAGKSDLLKAVVDRLVQKVETLLTDSGIIFVEKAQIIDFWIFVSRRSRRIWRMSDCWSC